MSQLENNEPAPAPPQPSGCAWPTAVVIIALAALVAFFFHYVTKRSFDAPGALVQGLNASAEKLKGLFGTEVRVDNQSVTLESQGILELATVQRRIVCVTKYETRWAGSTATVIIRGVYTAKAGFSLEKGATFRLDEQGRLIDSTIPPARLLSVSTLEQKVFFDANGVWKTLDARDYEEAFRQNRAQADKEAEQTGILEEARTRLKERISDMLPAREPAQTPEPKLQAPQQ